MRHLQAERFGRLTVMQRAAQKASWICLCDCGTERVVRTQRLISGQTMKPEWTTKKITAPGKYLIRPPGAKGEAYPAIITENDIRLGMYDGIEWVGPFEGDGAGGINNDQ